jgi:hypothetical protein
VFDFIRFSIFKKEKEGHLKKCFFTIYIKIDEEDRNKKLLLLMNKKIESSPCIGKR